MSDSDFFRKEKEKRRSQQRTLIAAPKLQIRPVWSSSVSVAQDPRGDMWPGWKQRREMEVHCEDYYRVSSYGT